MEFSEGFWREFFLLPPDRAQLHSLLDGLSADQMLSLQVSGSLFEVYEERDH